MKISVIEMQNTALSQLSTEIAYTVASCRAQGNTFLKITYSSAVSSVRSNILKVLKNMLKKGIIQLYIEEWEYYGSSREAQYLRNKHSDLADVCDGDGQGILVRL